jgi:hypothetical protein
MARWNCYISFNWVVCMNTRNKGNRVQREAIACLERAGYRVSKAGQQIGRFTKEKDFFGLFDLGGIKKGELVLVQITCNKPHIHKDFLDFSKEFTNNGVSYWQWVWYDRKGWVKWEYRFGGKVKYDLRK